jgi:hypothetical protein
MPVVAAIEGGRELSRRGDVGVAVEDVTDLVWIFLVDAGEGERREAFGEFRHALGQRG